MNTYPRSRTIWCNSTPPSWTKPRVFSYLLTRTARMARFRPFSSSYGCKRHPRLHRECRCSFTRLFSVERIFQCNLNTSKKVTDLLLGHLSGQRRVAEITALFGGNCNRYVHWCNDSHRHIYCTVSHWKPFHIFHWPNLTRPAILWTMAVHTLFGSNICSI